MAELSVYGTGIATADPELRHVGEKKTAVCSVNLAFNRPYKDKKTDKWESEACFLRVQVWGAKAEKMNETVKKGSLLYVVGGLKQDTWKSDDGQKRVAYSINARDFQLCVKNGKSSTAAQNNGGEQEQTVPPTESNNNIPF